MSCFEGSDRQHERGEQRLGPGPRAALPGQCAECPVRGLLWKPSLPGAGGQDRDLSGCNTNKARHVLEEAAPPLALTSCVTLEEPLASPRYTWSYPRLSFTTSFSV